MTTGLRIARETYDIGSVRRSDVLRYLGHRGQEISADLDARLDEIVHHCIELARPRGAISTFPVAAVGPDSIELEGCALALPGSSIAEHLTDATEVALLAVTLGADVDRELRRLSFVDAFEQVLFDAAATALVERAADAAEAQVRAYAHAKEAYTSWRFSPGYGDLPLEIQPTFLAVLDATRQLGITLTPSNLMVPTKSITALVGIHPTPQPGQETPCATCNLAEFCTIRPSGRTCRD